MKINFIAAAVAAAVASPAMAAIVDLSGAANVIYLSGATAQTPAIGKSLKNFCSGTFATYTDAVDGQTSYIYTCSAATAASGLSGSFTVLKQEGGSSNGVAPVVNQTAVAFLNPVLCDNAATKPTSANDNNIPLNGAVSSFAGTCSATTHLPHVGFSDVPSKIWTARGSFTPSAAAIAAGYTLKNNFVGQGFGVAASAALYTALQQDQVNAGYLDAACVGSSTVACQPSISKEQYAAIIQNNPGSPYQVSWAPLLNHSTLGGANLPTDLDVVSVCRRSTGSGTQASAEIYFLGNPCAKDSVNHGEFAVAAPGAYSFVDGSATTVATDVSFLVTAQANTGAVKSCLAGTTGNALVPSAPYALGVMSLENVPTATETWKWLKLNGVSPNVDATQKKTIVDGSYDFAFEVEMLYRNDVAATPANSKALADALYKTLADGSNLVSFAGIYADPTVTIVPATAKPAFVPGQTHKGSRGGNACQPHKLQF